MNPSIQEIITDLVCQPYDEISEELLHLDVYEKVGVDGEMLELIYNKFLDADIEGALWDFLISHLEHPLPVHIANMLIDRNLCLPSLGHSAQELSVMWRLAPLIDEAAIALGIWLFTDNRYEAELFEQFLYKHGDHYWVMQCLAYRESRSVSKNNLYRAYVLKHKRSDELEQLIHIVASEKKASSNHITGEEMFELFRMGEPKVLRALAMNPLTPKEILNELAQLSNVKLAKVIREQARKNLNKLVNATASGDPPNNKFRRQE